MSRFTQLRTGVLTAEPGSASFHCQTFFLEVRPPSQGASCWEHSPPTPPPRGRGPGRSSRQGQGTPQPAWRRRHPGPGLAASPLLSPTYHVTYSISDARVCPLGSCQRQAFGLQNRGIPAFVRDRGLSCGSLPRAQDRKGLWASLWPVCLPPRVLLQGRFVDREGAGRVRLACAPSRDCPARRTTQRPPARQGPPPELLLKRRRGAETTTGRHSTGEVARPGAQRFPKVLLPLGESPRPRRCPRPAQLRSAAAGQEVGDEGAGPARLAPPPPRPGPRPRPPCTPEPPSCRVG